MRGAGLARAAVLLLLVGLGGCGSDDGGDDGDGRAATDETRSGEVVDISGTDPVGQVVAGSVAALVTCSDWNGANEKERLATIADIRDQLAPQDEGIELPKLTDEEAAQVFDNACEPSHAAGFRLYKLYAQAAGFVTLKRAVEEAGEK